MAVLYSQDWEAYGAGTDLVPNVPNWTTTGTGGSYKIQNYFTSKALEIIGGASAAWAWLVAGFDYIDFTSRISQGAPCSVGVRTQGPTAAPNTEGYFFDLYGSGLAWNLVHALGGAGGGVVVASGTLPTYNPLDFQVRVIINSADQATYFINGVQITTFDWSLYGLPTGGVGYAVSPADTFRADDLLVTDASGIGSAALNDTRMRR